MEETGMQERRGSRGQRARLCQGGVEVAEEEADAAVLSGGGFA